MERDIKATSKLHSALWFPAQFPLHCSIRVGNRKSGQPCVPGVRAVVSVVGGHADRATGKRWCGDRGQTGGGLESCFLPRELGIFCLKIDYRMGGAGQLGSCQGVAAPRQATAARGFIEGKVWGGSGWKLRGRDSRVSLSGSDWRRHSSFHSSLSCCRAALERQSLPLISNYQH